MAAIKKSGFYHTRRNKVKINKERASEILSVTIEQINEWDDQGAPEHVERLLILWDKKHVGICGWDGWLFSRGTLRYKGQQWRPDNILMARYEIERASRLETQLKQLYSWSGLLKIANHLLLKAS
jgi:phage terminase Nu1 subunit (DNA packaging protein)